MESHPKYLYCIKVFVKYPSYLQPTTGGILPKLIRLTTNSYSTLKQGLSYESTIEEAKVGIRGDAKTLNQLSSSSGRALQERIKNALASLDSAARDLQARENDQGSSGGGAAQQQRGAGEI
ncbi:hypothetical protein APSETT445_005439 [Aspergillus pseudonomiae]